MTVNALQVQEYIVGLDYPLSKEDLVRRAQETGAGTAIIQLLRSLPADQFDSPAEVGSALSEVA
ncbi:hypothetical protein GCM10027290_62100 [Micromonospora sonneratiae]|jgi:hypothetical protein|uniref:DUF2795 domain-containing protein n=1 Tax=Micromonospora sonneratiae TaxID=1184706 RepID=A0ABW3YFV1_9ACTN